MRLEATIPDHRAQVLLDLADELGLSRSQVIDEAIALFLMAVAAVKRGHRVASLGSTGERELTTPLLAALELALAKGPDIVLSPDAIERVRALLLEARKPSPRLRRAAQRAAANKRGRP